MNSRTLDLAADFSICNYPATPFGLSLKKREHPVRIHVHVELLGDLVEPRVNAVTGFGATIQQLIEKGGHLILPSILAG
jgi:hypothetical protein